MRIFNTDLVLAEKRDGGKDYQSQIEFPSDAVL
jgi:hypothetical protein